MKKLETILVGIDFSNFCIAALQEAGRLSLSSQSTLQLVHCMSSEFVEQYREHFTTPIAEVISEIQQELGWFGETHLDPAVLFEVQVRIGHTVGQLIEAAAELDADLVVLGAHGRSSDGPDSVGANAARCVRNVKVPVLLVRSHQQGNFKRVVAGVDFSKASRLALDEAAVIADSNGATLHVLHVHRPPWIWFSHYARDIEPRPTSEYREEYESALKGQMNAFVSPVREQYPSLKVISRVLEYDGVARGMREYINETRADLIVIGARGQSGLKEMLLGTTAERLIRHSPCSVLTVKPENQ